MVELHRSQSLDLSRDPEVPAEANSALRRSEHRSANPSKTITTERTNAETHPPSNHNNRPPTSKMTFAWKAAGIT